MHIMPSVLMVACYMSFHSKKLEFVFLYIFLFEFNMINVLLVFIRFGFFFQPNLFSMGQVCFCYCSLSSYFFVVYIMEVM